MWSDGNDWFGMGGYGIVGIVLMVAVVALVIWGAGTLFNGRSGTAERPLEILRRRHAAGEINKSEYEETVKTLS